MQSNFRKCEHRHFIDFLLQPILIFELLSLRPRELRSKTGGEEGGSFGNRLWFSYCWVFNWQFRKTQVIMWA